MKPPTSLALIPLAIAVSLLTQCAELQEGLSNYPSGGTQYLAGYGPPPSHNSRQAGKPARYQPQGYWDGDGLHGPSKIRIVRHEQKAYFYKGNQLAGVAPISSGDLDHSTPAGRYRVTEKDIDHTSSLYGTIKRKGTGETINNNAEVRRDKPGPGEYYEPAPMPNFLRFNKAIGMHTGYLPGYAASHGCVRLPDYMAQKFYENSHVGTVVIVE